MNETAKTHFAPQLYIKAGITDISFYEKAFGAIELRRWTNDDNSIHVAELCIDGAMFHIHEEKLTAGQFSPEFINGTTALIGLFVSNVDEILAKAIDAGAILVSPVQSYDYGYRQGEIKDPFGHIWLIEMKYNWLSPQYATDVEHNMKPFDLSQSSPLKSHKQPFNRNLTNYFCKK